MSDTISATGKCLCGAVKFNADSINPKIGACHCSMCRSLCAGPYMAVDCGKSVNFEDTSALGIFNSSDWAERGFCKECGSQIFYKLKQTGQYIVSIGVFPDDLDFIFDHQVFIDEKPGYYEFSNKTHDMTGAEVFEMFSAELSD